MKKISKLSFLLFFLSFFINSTVFMDTADEMKKDIWKINKEIKSKNIRIKKIDTEKNSLEKQIYKNTKEIEKIKEEQIKILSEINVLSKNIDYSEKSLKVSNEVLKSIKSNNKLKLKSWNRYSIDKTSEEFSPEVIISFKKILNNDTNRIEKASTIKIDIIESKSNVEKEQKKLQSLQDRLKSNGINLDKKISNHGILIKKLEREKGGHRSRIAKLIKEKKRIERQIRNVINKSTKVDKKLNLKTARKNIGKLSIPLNGKIVTRYGQKRNTIASNGLEIRGELGSPIKAAGAGKVIYSDTFQGLGKVVMIDYGNNLIGVYGNLISTSVAKGKILKRSEVIGVLGFANGGKPDLYYELRFKLKSINPEEFF